MTSWMGPAALALLAATTVSPPAAGTSPIAPRPVDLETERFLAAAEPLDKEPIGAGVTRSLRVTLSDGTRTARAIWKTIDERAPFKRFDDGTFEMGFSDSYKYEIAAYELDKLLGLGLVPPTVERKLWRQRGSLQLWVENVVTEADRLARGEKIGDPALWNRQVYAIRLFHNLTYNTDFNNVSNLLSDADSRVYLIDHSRAFRTKHELLAQHDLEKFSRRGLEALRALDLDSLTEALGRWLSKTQIEALLARRDLILARAEKLIAEQGESEVLFD